MPKDHPLSYAITWCVGLSVMLLKGFVIFCYYNLSHTFIFVFIMTTEHLLYSLLVRLSLTYDFFYALLFMNVIILVDD